MTMSDLTTTNTATAPVPVDEVYPHVHPCAHPFPIPSSSVCGCETPVNWRCPNEFTTPRNFEMDDDDGYLEIDDLGNPIGADIVESDNDVGTCLDIISA